MEFFKKSQLWNKLTMIDDIYFKYIFHFQAVSDSLFLKLCNLRSRTIPSDWNLQHLNVMGGGSN